MKLTTLQKLGGLSLIAGSVFLTAYSVFFASLLPIGVIRNDITVAVLNPNWIWITSTAFLGVILMIFGFTAVYSKMYQDSGITGFIGYCFVEIAYMLQACKVTWEIFLYPVICAHQPFIPLLKNSIIKSNQLVVIFMTVSRLSIFIGIILFCLALIRSKEFPKIGGIFILTGALIYGFGPMLSVIVAISGITIFSIGCFILGLRLYKQYYLTMENETTNKCLQPTPNP
jgi:hypothetical protein